MLLALLLVTFIHEALGRACGSYDDSCAAELGTPLKDGTIFELIPGERIFFTFAVDDTNAPASVDIISSLLYGSIDMYGALNRKAKPRDKDFTTVNTPNQDYMKMDLASHIVAGSTGNTVNVMISAVSKCKLRVVASTSSFSTTLVNGMPQRDNLYGASRSDAPCTAITGFPADWSKYAACSYYHYRPTSLQALSFILTSFSSSTVGDPDLFVFTTTLTPAQISKVSRTWNSSQTGSDSVTLMPLQGDLNQDIHVIVALKKAPTPTKHSHNDAPVVSETAIYTVVASQLSVDAPLTLLGGLSQEDGSLSMQTNTESEKYYVLDVPAGREDVVFSLDPIFGDADLFVNRESDGFYHAIVNESAVHPVATVARWSSHIGTGQDSVTIPADDPHAYYEGGKYMVTIFLHGRGRYLLRGFTSTTVVTLNEDVPIVDFVSKNTYHYFRFFDLNSKLAVEFNANPSSGDSDIYVSCGINPTGDDSGTPSRATNHHNYSSQVYNEDTIVVDPKAPQSCTSQGVFYLSVFGYTDSTFTVTAVHAGGTLQLLDGLPLHNQRLFNRQSAHYRILVGYEIEDILLTVTPVTGDPDIFVKFGDGPLTRFINDFSSMKFGTEADTIVIPESRVPCQNCWLNVLVTAYTDSQYSIVYSLRDSTIMLSNAVPIKESVAASLVQYYSFRSNVNGSVTTVVTLLSGFANLYVSSTETHPSASTADTLSFVGAELGGLPVITEKNVGSGDMVYVGVGGMDSNATFTIRAHVTESETSNDDQAVVTDDDISTGDDVGSDIHPVLLKLLNGIPQADSMGFPGSSWRYYQIPMTAGHELLDIVVTTLIGEVDIYAMKCPHQGYECAGTHGTRSYLPNETYTLATSAGMDLDIIQLNRNDNASCSYVIGIESTNYYSRYMISVSQENTVLMLQAGVTVTDTVAAKQYDYFVFNNGNNLNAIQFSLTNLAGDADLYISVKDTHPKATSNTTFWYSAAFGSDTVVINPLTDAHACLQCSYHISVFGFQDASYTLSASFQSSITHLSNGRPVSGSVTDHSWKFYVFSLSFNIGDHLTRDVSIVLTTLSGDADMYVTVDGSIPTHDHWSYKSGETGSADVVNIAHSDANYAPCATGSCEIRIAVWGFRGADFVITASTSLAATLLQVGVSRSGDVLAGEYQMYRVTHAAGNDKGMRVAVTQFSGHVQLFVTCGNVVTAINASNALWKLTNTGSSYSLDINQLDIKEHPKCSASGFLLSVYGNTTATYQLLVTELAGGGPTLLPASATLSGQVPSHSMTYYYFRPSPTANSNASAAPLSLRVSKYDKLDAVLRVYTSRGSVGVFVSADWESRPLYNADTDTVTGYKYAMPMDSGSSSVASMSLNHHLIESLCHDRFDCYVIVGVFGAGATGDLASYSITMSLQDSTVTLQSGVPVRGQVNNKNSEFYHFTLTIPKRDVVVALTPLSGDPDVYISLAPNTHPSRTNFTWMSASLGVDTLTLQYDQYSKLCIPDAAHHHNCEFFIAVYGWHNSTYSLTVSMDEGFLNPTALVDGQPQNGAVETHRYAYYKYWMPFAVTSPLSSSIRFTLTPTNGGDQDMFVKIGSSSGSDSVPPEPSMKDYDYKSTSWAGTIDEIEITASGKNYCLNCMVYVAVYGYTAGSFSIVVTSTGATILPMGVAVGGHVDSAQYRYYSFSNTNPLAVLTFSLTPMSGDPDLYISSYTSTQSTGTGEVSSLFPTKEHSTWRSLSGQDDTVIVKYSDDHFCVDCHYVVGVYGFRNASFTLLVTQTEDAVIALVPNRPQITKGSANSVRYYKVVLGSDLQDITISLTALDTGDANMFAQVYHYTNSTQASSASNVILPDPSNPSTYKYSTVASSDDIIYVPHGIHEGHHDSDKIIVYVVAVKVDSDSQYMMVASTSQLPVLLQPGVPQDHYVSRGSTEQFIFYPSDDEDVRVTLTARSGDPDLLISAGARAPVPTCKYASTTSWRPVCANMTWSSASYSTDQIVISKDYPCQKLMPSTIVSDKCDPRHTGGVGVPLNIVVFGFSSSKFTIMVAATGQHVTLLPGRPQVSSTAAGFICSSRSLTTGACSPTSSTSMRAQLSYFTFKVSPTSMGGSDGGSLVVSVTPLCNSSLSSASQSSAVQQYNHGMLRHLQPYSRAAVAAFADVTGEPGEYSAMCDNSTTLDVFVTSCAQSKCSEAAKFPSSLPGQHDAQLKLAPITTSSSHASNLFIINDPAHRHNGYCDVEAAGEACVYYISVLSANAAAAASADLPDTNKMFMIEARTPGDVSVIPCVSPAARGQDGFLTTTHDILTSPSVASHDQVLKYYEICNHPSGSSGAMSSAGLRVTLEQCIGKTDLYACVEGDGSCGSAVLPTTSVWGYYSDHVQSCSHGAGGGVRCVPTEMGSTADGLAPMPVLSLPSTHASSNNYVIMAAGVGEYDLHVQETTAAGLLLTPAIMHNGIDGQNSHVTLSKVSETSISLEWFGSKVRFPGMSVLLEAEELKYTVYVIDVTDPFELEPYANFVLTSECGLEALTHQYPTRVRKVLFSPYADKDTESHTVNGLTGSRTYEAVVVAHCDSSCLRQISKTNPLFDVSSGSHGPLITCEGGTVGCARQSSVYYSTTATTLKIGSSPTGGMTTGMLFMIIAGVLIGLFGVAAIGYYCYLNGTKLRDQFGHMFTAYDVKKASTPEEMQFEIMERNRKMTMSSSANTAVTVKEKQSRNTGEAKSSYLPPALFGKGGAGSYAPLTSAQDGDSDEEVVVF